MVKSTGRIHALQMQDMLASYQWTSKEEDNLGPEERGSEVDLAPPLSQAPITETCLSPIKYCYCPRGCVLPARVLIEFRGVCLGLHRALASAWSYRKHPGFYKNCQQLARETELHPARPGFSQAPSLRGAELPWPGCWTGSAQQSLEAGQSSQPPETPGTRLGHTWWRSHDVFVPLTEQLDPAGRGEPGLPRTAAPPSASDAACLPG